MIIDRTNNTLMAEDYLKAPEVPDAFEGLKLLAQKFKVYIISRCAQVTEEKTRYWLAHKEFSEKTGIPIENVRFCRKKAEKAQICKELGITDFIDDKSDVLNYMLDRESNPRLFLFKPSDIELAKNHEMMRHMIKVNNWKELLKYFIKPHNF